MNADHRHNRYYDRYATLMSARHSQTRSQRQSDKAIAWRMRHWLPTRKDARILDLGCGCGEMLEYFRRTGYEHIRGVDLSEEQVELAKQRHLTVIKKSAVDYLEEPSSRFDLIIALDVVEHLDKDTLDRFLAGCYQTLSDGGRLVIQTVNPASPFFGACRYGDITHNLAISPDMLRRLLELHSFEQIEIRSLDPIPLGYSIMSSIRFVLWKAISAALQAMNVVETGAKSLCLTRNFILSAKRTFPTEPVAKS